ncbi:PREDICTED: intracellular protein transport protein uso1-like isoform X2 [Camelina sativa]|uniref:Intracellular protein transport protein uso1-like isoform X2 n=1 Tax=Camelina sativa TaxID=90675 RepID=A0ABM0XH35_CAMSA|nr:PREDICTED: intracellular protein transport protein uso1-like isoform X2 [Camelina sativa]
MVEDDLGFGGLERQKLRKSMEKIKADASGVITCVRQLKGLLDHFGMVEGNIEKRSRELDLKEKELQILSSDLEKKSQTFEEEKSKAGDLKKLAEECTQELRLKRNDLTVKLESLTRVQSVLELKDKQLGQLVAELKRRCNEARSVQERKKEMEAETERKKKELTLIVHQIEESGKLLEKRSREVELMEKDIEEKGKELDLVKSQVNSWEEKLVQLRTLVNDDCTTEVSPRKEQADPPDNTPVEVELKKKQLGQTKTVLVKHTGVEEDNNNLGLTPGVNVVVMSSSDVKSSTDETKHPQVL